MTFTLQQHLESEAQAREFDADELMNTRLELRPDMNRSTVTRIQTTYESQYRPFAMQNPEGMFPRCWMNMSKNPALSVSGFVVISRSKQQPARKKRTRIVKPHGQYQIYGTAQLSFLSITFYASYARIERDQPMVKRKLF